MNIANIIAPYLAGVTALAALIIPIVTFTRKHILTRMDGWEVVILAVILGDAASITGYLTHATTMTLLAAAVFGAFAGLYSAGLVATLKGGAKTITVILMQLLKQLLPPNTAPTDNGGDSGKPPVAPTTPSTPSPTP